MPVWPNHLTTVPGLRSSAPPWVRAYGRAGSAGLGWCRSRGWLPGSSHPRARFRRGPWQHGNSVFRAALAHAGSVMFSFIGLRLRPRGTLCGWCETLADRGALWVAPYDGSWASVFCSQVKSARFSEIKPLESRHRQAVSLKTEVDLAWTRDQNSCKVESCLGHCCSTFTLMTCRFTSRRKPNQVPVQLS